MPSNLATVRRQVESALAGRGIHAPFAYRDRRFVETVPAGIAEIDSIAGGLPRGGLTEICGPPCSGRTTLLFSALASRAANAEVCALIDGHDSFDPHSAEAAGVELKQLLWVRCRDINQALRATDLLLQAGGFGMIAVDLSDIAPQTVRYVPLNAWFRFRRAVEGTPTILVLVEQESNAKTCASLVLQVGSGNAHWMTTANFTAEAAGDAPASDEPAESCATPAIEHPAACLLGGFEVRARVLRSRIQPLPVSLTGTDGRHHFGAAHGAGKRGEAGIDNAAIDGGVIRDPAIGDAISEAETYFDTQTIWS